MRLLVAALTQQRDVGSHATLDTAVIISFVQLRSVHYYCFELSQQKHGWKSTSKIHQPMFSLILLHCVLVDIINRQVLIRIMIIGETPLEMSGTRAPFLTSRNRDVFITIIHMSLIRRKGQE